MRTTTQILAAIGAADGTGRSLPDLLCVDCARSLDLAGAGITLMNDDGSQAVVGTSGPLASWLEELQFDLGEGPSLDAARTNRTVDHDDLDSAVRARWSAFSSSALAAGIRAVTALPLQVGGVRLGSLCLYRSTPGRLDPDRTTAARAYGAAAVVVLLRLQEQVWPRGTLPPELGEPVAYRAVVHQATGFLSVTASVAIADALLLMRAHAFATEQSLVHVAREVLAGRVHIHPEENEDD
ncbi:GAF and ANTAR domain-containing protein [Nocardioides daeguensis]|uniref:GAF domain-containing protein n=1 Tax=Nocardioides daeguensis TaxID=908359 RepID=A0ABP6V936_9ACTN|nr:GAF and ANTAR domain-containing protein [Nocardioides daeguensis]MBV6726454.1 GAF and ANTAR domain-containing protein [Nocardioides daeguensis]MCR1772297.1 GAF and ANTAR domain-containing protein [Nocardioides daeguensis]